jgi:hypothetical protein
MTFLVHITLPVTEEGEEGTDLSADELHDHARGAKTRGGCNAACLEADGPFPERATWMGFWRGAAIAYHSIEAIRLIQA